MSFTEGASRVAVSAVLPHATTKSGKLLVAWSSPHASGDAASGSDADVTTTVEVGGIVGLSQLLVVNGQLVTGTHHLGRIVGES